MKTNKYEGYCVNCGGLCPPGTAELVWDPGEDDGGWLRRPGYALYHLDKKECDRNKALMRERDRNRRRAAERPFTPDWKVPPSETILEAMADHRVGKEELAQLLGLTSSEMRALLSNKMPITPEIAVGLSEAFEIPARFWLNLQKNYDTGF